MPDQRRSINSYAARPLSTTRVFARVDSGAVAEATPKKYVTRPEHDAGAYVFTVWLRHVRVRVSRIGTCGACRCRTYGCLAVSRHRLGWIGVADTGVWEPGRSEGSVCMRWVWKRLVWSGWLR